MVYAFYEGPCRRGDSTFVRGAPHHMLMQRTYKICLRAATLTAHSSQLTWPSIAYRRRRTAARALSLGLLNLRSWPFGILSPPPHWERSGSGKRCAAARWSQGIVSPPSTDRLCPVTAFDASEAKKTHACVCVWQRRLLECRRLCYSLFDAPPFSGGPAVPPLDLLLSVGR